MAACLCALVALASPVPSAAAPGGGQRIFFRAQGSNGYRLYALGEGATGALVLTRGRRPDHPGASASVYIARAKAGRTRFSGTFGKLGRLDVRFRPSGRVKYGKRHRHCIGPDRYATHYGVFAGTIRFKGEGGYTAVRAHRVKGRMVTPAVLDCFSLLRFHRTATIWDALFSPSTMNLTGRPSPEVISSIDLRSPPRLPHLLGGHGRRTALSAAWHVGVSAEAFGAFERGRRRPVFFAGTLQSQERLAVVRLAAAVGTPADLLASNSLGTAAVTPPPPFGGEATFRHFDNGTKSWTGSLAVSLPGAPGVPLTGPQFKVALNRGL